MTASPTRHVSSHLVLQVYQPLQAVLQVAVADHAPATVEQTLQVRLDGTPLEPKLIDSGGVGRIHSVAVQPGHLTIDYTATVRGTAAQQPVTDHDRIVYLRPSRYAESDRLGPIAQAEFAGVDGAPALLAAVSSWVGSQLSYVPGSSGPTDGAVDTLLQRQGVCRDYAHLVVALLRALGVPARLAAVYAPGLDPMDFHAVAEAVVGDQWCAVDATLLAPRSSLVRIVAGRDAADTAFLSTYGGGADLLESQVTAVIDGMLPGDDVTALVNIG